MAGAIQRYRHISILITVTLLLTTGCTKQEKITAISEEPANYKPPAPASPPPRPPTAAVKPAPKPQRMGGRAIPVRKAYQEKAKSGGRRISSGMGAFLGGRLSKKTGIPPYPAWPPETPSSRVSLDRFITARTNLSLYDAGQKLKRSFEDAGYLEYSYFAAPGGFVLVTRIEKISAKGDPLPGTERYKLPNQRSSGSLTSFVRGLFLDAPPGFYRYIAVVVSDEPYRTSRQTLTSKKAEGRLRAGSNNLSAVYKKVAFASDHNVDALIYEFTKNARTGKVRMIAPGRLEPRIHLTKTKLNKTIRSNFRR